MSNDNQAAYVWTVSALNKAIADSLKARFAMVSVQGELSGFTKASSGHCYFNLKDSGAQIRCALFRRTAEQLNFSPRDGQLVQAQARVAVYEPRGEMQLVIEALRPAGAGQLHEAFLQLKASGVTILLVEQNIHFAQQLGDSVAVMDNGRVIHAGSMAALSADPELQQSLLGLAL